MFMVRAGRLQVSGYALDGIRFDPSGHKGMRKLISKALSVPSSVLHIVRGAALRGYYPNAYQNQWKGFVGAIESGKRAGASFSDGMAATRVALAATQSASCSGRSVRIVDCLDMIAPVHGYGANDDRAATAVR